MSLVGFLLILWSGRGALPPLQSNGWIQDSIDAVAKRGGGLVTIPPGVYLVSGLTMPAIVPGGPVSLQGAGPRATILVPRDAGTVVLRGPATGVYQGGVIGGFSIRAHPNGSDAAIVAQSFRATVFENIELLSNGPTGIFADGIRLYAGGFSYGNTFRRIIVDNQTGPRRVFGFTNLAGDPRTQANANRIEDLLILDNTGIEIVVDARRSALLQIVGGLIEGNAGAIAIVPGTLTSIEGVWFEGNGQAIEARRGPDGASNGVRVRDNYFSLPTTLHILPGLSGWTVEGNQPAGNLRVIDQGSKNVIRR